MMMKSPVIKSATSDCAPKPTASPITPAPASSGVTFSPRFAAVTMPAIISSPTNTTLRTSGSIVRARMLGPRDLPRATFGLSASWIAVSIRIQISHTMKNVRMIALTACVMPRAATLSSASFASEKPQKRDDTSKNAIQMPSTISVPTNFTSRRTYADWRRGLCGCARVMRDDDRGEEERDDEQPGGRDRHLQHVLGRADAGERRDHRGAREQQHRQLPERRDDLEGFRRGAPVVALLVRAASDQVRDRPLERKREIPGQYRRAHVRDRRNQP